MRIVHTGDWHLGKNLEGSSRLDEQEEFLDFFVKKCEELKPNIVLIAGDIYDTTNPPARAEKLFYDTLKKLSRNGDCISLVIAGNHDNPERIVSAAPLAMEHGIIMFGTLKTIIQEGVYGNHKVTMSGEGFVEIEINGQKVVILAMAYPSEKRLNEVFYSDTEEEKDRIETYGDKIKNIFENLEQNFRDDAINLVVSHIFAFGSEPTGSERSSSLGGSFLVSTDVFPKKADYVALGHIHKPQILPKTDGKIRYSGSPIHYNKSEINIDKKFYVIDFEEEMKISEVDIPVFKPIEVWKTSSIDEAIEKCKENKGEKSWVYLEVETDRYIKEDEIKKMKSYKKDILEIRPIIKSLENQVETERIAELSFEEQFAEFYKMQKDMEPSKELVEMLISILEEEENETDKN